MISAKTLVLLVAAAISNVEPHAHMVQPWSRTSMWSSGLYPTQPPYYDIFGVWCGNVQQDLAYSTCGRCGEPPGGTEFSQGGPFGQDIIVANYTAGQIIEVIGVGGGWHWGNYEVELCAEEKETDNCFMRLPIVGGSEPVRIDNKICIPCDNCQNDPKNNVVAMVQLPAGVTCNRCTLRWTYRTSYPGPADWDSCNTDAPAQTFRNCADVAIH